MQDIRALMRLTTKPLPTSVGSWPVNGRYRRNSSAQRRRPDVSRRRTAYHLWTPPSRQGKTLGSLLRVVGCCHLSGLGCGRKTAAGLYGSSRTGSRSPKACSKHSGKPWLSQSRLADGCAILSFRSPSRPRDRRQLRCRGRSSVGAAFDQQGPDDAGHLVGQRNGDQLARATVTSIFGLRANICASHEPWGALRRLACSTTALAPMINRRRIVRSPRFETAPSFCLPPVDFCSGVSPSQAAKSRPAGNLRPLAPAQ